MRWTRPKVSPYQPIFVDKELFGLLQKWAEKPKSRAFIAPIAERLRTLGFLEESLALVGGQDWDWWANEIGTRTSTEPIRHAFLHDKHPIAVMRMWFGRFQRGMIFGPMWDALDDTDQMTERAAENVKQITQRWDRFGMTSADVKEEIDVVLRHSSQLAEEDAQAMEDRVRMATEDMRDAEERERVTKELLADHLVKIAEPKGEKVEVHVNHSLDSSEGRT